MVNRAQIKWGTFYAHYADIPDVISHLIQETFSNIREVLSQQNISLPELPHALLYRIQLILEEDLNFYRKILNSNASALMQEQLVQITMEYLLQHEAEFGISNHEQYVTTMRFCAGGLSSLYRDWFGGQLPFSLKELTNRCEGLLLHTIHSVL